MKERKKKKIWKWKKVYDKKEIKKVGKKVYMWLLDLCMRRP
jgi:hypothetical protein